MSARAPLLPLAAALCLAAATALPAAAQEADPHVFFQAPTGGLTRAQVRLELTEARLAGVLPTPGEAGDSDAVLLAREQFNQRQATVLLARQRAEQEHAVALREAEIALAAATADYVALEWLGLLDEDADAVEMDIQVLEPAADAEAAAEPGSDETVIVSLAGGDEEQLRRRAQAIRQQLVAMGLRREQVYIEQAQG